MKERKDKVSHEERQKLADTLNEIESLPTIQRVAVYQYLKGMLDHARLQDACAAAV